MAAWLKRAVGAVQQVFADDPGETLAEQQDKVRTLHREEGLETALYRVRRARGAGTITQERHDELIAFAEGLDNDPSNNGSGTSRPSSPFPELSAPNSADDQPSTPNTTRGSTTSILALTPPVTNSTPSSTNEEETSPMEGIATEVAPEAAQDSETTDVTPDGAEAQANASDGDTAGDTPTRAVAGTQKGERTIRRATRVPPKQPTDTNEENTPPMADTSPTETKPEVTPTDQPSTNGTTPAVATNPSPASEAPENTIFQELDDAVALLNRQIDRGRIPADERVACLGEEVLDLLTDSEDFLGDAIPLWIHLRKQEHLSRENVIDFFKEDVWDAMEAENLGTSMSRRIKFATAKVALLTEHNFFPDGADDSQVDTLIDAILAGPAPAQAEPDDSTDEDDSEDEGETVDQQPAQAEPDDSTDEDDSEDEGEIVAQQPQDDEPDDDEDNPNLAWEVVDTYENPVLPNLVPTRFNYNVTSSDGDSKPWQNLNPVYVEGPVIRSIYDQFYQEEDAEEDPDRILNHLNVLFFMDRNAYTDDLIKRFRDKTTAKEKRNPLSLIAWALYEAHISVGGVEAEIPEWARGISCNIRLSYIGGGYMELIITILRSNPDPNAERQGSAPVDNPPKRLAPPTKVPRRR